MATGIVIVVAEKVFAVLHSEELREICSMFGYESQLDDLKITVSTIKCVFLDAESKHQELSQEDGDYIERLKEAVYDVNDLLDEFNTIVQKNKHLKGGKLSEEVCRFFCRTNQFLVAYNMSHEIKSLRSKLDKIAKDRQQFGFTDVYMPIKRRQDTMSYGSEDSIVGREIETEAIVEMLLGDVESSNDVGHTVSFVTIVGIGGLGKTALARLVYNDGRIEKAFELRFWVCVISDEFVLEKIFRQMLGRDVCHIEDLQTQARTLIGGKRYLLVLDDVWSENCDEWDKLKPVLELGSRGSRVVITSRSKKIAKVVGHDSMYELKGLSEENSWTLFKKLAFEQGKEPTNSTDHLFDIGKEIVKKCADVPLAIRVVASMLYEQDEIKWISLKDANLMEMGLGENGVMPMLKYSYYHLTPALKSCFSHCALFPKDFKIKKDLLIRLWLAQGCLDQPGDHQNEEDVGDEYFSILVHRCFLQDVGKNHYGEIYDCKMHDLIHDFAQQVAGKETLMLDSHESKFDKRSCHLSFTTNACDLLTRPISQLSDTNILRTFLTVTRGVNNQDLFESNVTAIFSHLKRLRVLHLNGFEFDHLPDIVCNLSHLRYLDLSDNGKLKVLPNSITELYNLHVLNLDQTGVRELPIDMRKLVNLRHLSLRYCLDLTHMPPGLDTLTSLQTLTVFEVGNKACDQGNIGKLRDLNALVNLRGELSITFQNDSSCDVANYREVELLRTPYLTNLTILFSYQGDFDETVLACLQPRSTLKVITIHSYKAYKLPRWAESLTSSLPNLTQIYLMEFDSLENLPSLSKLRHLNYLALEGMPNVDFMESDVVVGPSDEEFVFFPSLEDFKLSGFSKLKGWWREEIIRVTGEMGSSSAVFPSFPSLRKLFLEDCPSLTTFPSCPNLCKLDLYHCHGTLAFLSSGIHSLYMDKVKADNIRTLDRLFGRSLEGIRYLALRSFEGESLSTLAKKCVQDAASIKKLEVSQCVNLTSLAGVKHFTCLQRLSIYLCENLELENNEGAIMTPWESLHSLSSLELISLPKLINLPREFQYLNALQSLEITYVGLILPKLETQKTTYCTY